MLGLQQETGEFHSGWCYMLTRHSSSTFLPGLAKLAKLPAASREAPLLQVDDKTQFALIIDGGSTQLAPGRRAALKGSIDSAVSTSR